MASVQLRNVTKAWGDVVVSKDINLDIHEVEFVVFVGPSGCGKSTLLRMIAGLETITSGDLFIGDTRMNEIPPAERGVGMVFQSYALYPHLSVAENMSFGLKLAGAKKDLINQRVTQVAEVLQLAHLLERKPKALSGGQRQRVAIGRTLVAEPSVFLLDEPLSNLDAKLRVQMRTAIKKLQRRLGITTIYVTHDQEEALAISDRIAVMKEGNIMQVGTPEAIYKKPENTFVAGFIGVSNFVECDVKGDDPNQAVLDIKGECSITCTLKKPFTGKGIISARPEQLFFDKENGLPGRIVMSTFLGDFIEYEIELNNGQTLQLNEYTKDVQTVRPDGQNVKVNFDIHAVGVYDAATQEVISW